MKIKELYTNSEIIEPISLNSYLNKNNITDIEEFLNPSGKYLEDWSFRDEVLMGVKEIGYWLNYRDGKIIIIQDGDTDGICSTIIIYDYLTKLNPNWDINILIHSGKQRGLDDEEIMNKITELKPNLVIIPDAGTNNYIQAQKLNELNIGLIVLDHHDYAIPTEENPNDRPIECGILINNQDSKYDSQKDGSGALVTHKFVQCLDKYFNVNYSNKYIDLVALSLVSDSMNMNSMENRLYYHFGLETIDNINNKFLLALFKEFIGDRPYTQRDISFKVIPKLNSICRSTDIELKQNIILSFISDCDDYSEILEYCKNAHENQKKVVSEIIDNNIDKINGDNNIIFFASDDIPKSYSGLISGKIMNMFGGKPTIVGSIKDDIFIGSLRSPIPLRSDFVNTKLFEFAQGHEDSCGVKIKLDNISKIIEHYNNVDLSYEPCIEVLKSIDIDKYNINRLFREFDGYDYLWGKGISAPLFHFKNIKINPKNDIQIMKDNRTIKIQYKDIVLMLFMSTKEDKERLCLGYYEDDKFVLSPKDIILRLECVGKLNINRYTSPKTNKTYINNQIMIDSYEVEEYKRKLF